ncbi:hypothetical protein P3S68_029125 [Capsicum galapagoense]
MNNFYGTIPPEIGNLTNLICLDLHTNQISGTIPSQIGSLVKLQILHIFGNHLNGPIPEEISYLREFKQAIPQCFGNMSSHLEVLDMQHSNLSGTLPTTFSIGSALGSFNLHGNKLEGKIPRSLENCQPLEVLDLGGNLLNDTFPMWLGTLPELRVLSLRLNKLHGPIRTSGSEYMFLELQILDLSRNDFSKNLPMSLFRHMKAMRTIDQISKEPSHLGIHIIMILLQFHPRGWSLNLTASPEVIIILVRTVSIGYEARPAPLVISHPRAKLAKKLSCKYPYKPSELFESTILSNIHVNQ